MKGNTVTEERQVREELTGRIAARVSLSPEDVARMLTKDTTLSEIWGDYMLCRETIDRFRMAGNTGEARAAEYETHAASLEDEIVRRVQELRA